MKRVLSVVTVCFFLGMLVLTVKARDIHEAGLPHVSAQYLTKQYFANEAVDENGGLQISSESALAIPKDMFGKPVYVLYRAEKNGEERSFVRLADIEVGRENNGYYEVVEGLMFNDRIVIDERNELNDGMEVVEVSMMRE